jgi:hypothetical protein
VDGIEQAAVLLGRAASATIQSDERHAETSTTTNKIGCIDKKCDIDVAVSGEPIRHFPSGDYCASGENTCCRAIQANLTIPETGAP